MTVTYNNVSEYFHQCYVNPKLSLIQFQIKHDYFVHIGLLLNSWWFVHKAQLWSCDSILTTHWYTCSLVPGYPIHAAGFEHCLLPIHTTFVSCTFICSYVRFLYIPTTTPHLLQHVLWLMSAIVNTSFQVMIQFWSRSNPHTVCGLSQSSFNLLTIHFRAMWIKRGHDWSRFNPHQSSFEAPVWTGL